MERRFAYADADILYRGLSLTRLIARGFRWGAGTRAVPDIDEPERRARNGTGSGEGCPELAQAGSTLAWTIRRLTPTFLTLSSTSLPSFSPSLDSQITVIRRYDRLPGLARCRRAAALTRRSVSVCGPHASRWGTALCLAAQGAFRAQEPYRLGSVSSQLPIKTVMLEG
jgi:hypothetical protein